MTGAAFPIDASAGSPAFASEQIRTSLGALMAGRTDRALGARSGLHPGSDPSVSFSGLTYTVTPFCGVSDPGTAANVGAFLVAFTANETGTLNAADATNPRVDRLDVQVPDGDSGSRVAALVYTVGAPGASPSAPAAPVRSWALGTISVPKSGSGSPSWSPAQVYTAAAGGIVPVPDGSHYPASPHVGMAAYRIDDDSLRIWDGALWDLIGGGAVGTLTNQGVAALSGFTISTSKLKRSPGGTVAIYVSGTLTSTITVPASGNIVNTPLAQVTDARFLMASDGFEQPLTTGLAGGNMDGTIGVDGTVSLNTVAPGTSLASGTAITLAGTYIL
jgi:hypothetical protein